MSMAIALLALLALLVLVLRPSPAFSTPLLVPPTPPPRRVSPPLSRSLSLPAPRRWSSPFRQRKHSVPASPQPADQLGRLHPHVQSFPSRRFPTPLRLSLSSKQRSSSASCTLTSVHLDQVATPSFAPATRAPPQRARFSNPFTKHSRSRTLSPPSSSGKSPDASPNPSTSSSSSPSHRRTFLNKLKSIFKSVPPEPSPIVRSKPIFKLRRKPVSRTQPYGPPWNAPMPAPDFVISPRSLQKPGQTMSPRHTSRKHSVRQGSRSELTPLSPGQLSPCAFINELDEKLSLLQQQRMYDTMPLPR